MAKQYLIPSWGFQNETGTRQYFIPGQGFINETVAAGSSVASAAGTSTATAVGSAVQPAAFSAAGTSTAHASSSSASPPVAPDYFVAGGYYVRETGTRQYMVPGQGYLNETSFPVSVFHAAGTSTAHAVGAGGSGGAGSVAHAAGISTASAISAQPGRDYLIAGGLFLNETNTRQYLVPGQGYVNETRFPPSVFLAAGTSTAHAVASTGVSAVASAAGTSTATAAPKSLATAVASAAGTSTAQALGIFIPFFYTNLTDLFNYFSLTAQETPVSSGAGLSVGTSTAEAASAIAASSQAHAAGTSSAHAVPPGASAATFSAAGTSTAHAVSFHSGGGQLDFSRSINSALIGSVL